MVNGTFMDKVFVTINGYFSVDLMKKLMDVFSSLGFENKLVTLHSSKDSLRMEFTCQKDKFNYSPDFFYEVKEHIEKKITVTKNNENEYTITITR